MLHQVISDELGPMAHIYELGQAKVTTFPTPAHFPMQFGVHVNTDAKAYEPHVHKPAPRTITSTAEFIFVQKGELQVVFLDELGRAVGEAVLKPNMALLQVRGGHDVRSLPDTVFFELKQGPYLGRDADKYSVTSPLPGSAA